MRKLLYFVVAALLSGFALTSCLDDNDGNTKTTQNYYGQLDTIYFSDPADTVFKSYISKAFTKLQVTNSVWSESARVEYSTSMAVVVAMANGYAVQTYKKTLDTLSLARVKNTIFSENSDSMTRMGYPNASAIPLDHFYAWFRIVNMASEVKLDTALYSAVE